MKEPDVSQQQKDGQAEREEDSRASQATPLRNERLSVPGLPLTGVQAMIGHANVDTTMIGKIAPGA